MNSLLIPIILGQTAVGKTSISIRVAQIVKGEIISADAMQVYRQMNLATAKPSPEQLRQVPHHLINFLDISEPYSVARFYNLASDLIPEIQRRGRMPLVVGGSALYLKALVDGLSPGPAPNQEYRSQLAGQEEKHGQGYLYRRLLELDPKAAQGIHRHDLKRTIRALEVIELTGRSISRQEIQWPETSLSQAGHFDHDAKGEEVMPEYRRAYKNSGRFVLIGLRRDKEDLHQRINQRLEKMFAAGLVEETRNLIQIGARDHRVAWQALGYKEVERCLGGECSGEEARAHLALKTRQFAKRQMTWWRRDPRIVWVDLAADTSIEVAAEQVVKIIQSSRKHSGGLN